ncbi:MAG: gliding motility-associated C-terminal domain-containing protein [Bacteroidales bacterium]|nr:gliding motility-associated C-terminal domain-containing protein [Bacteroidales bacterium]
MLLKKILPVLALAILPDCYAQSESISGVINSYYKVEEVFETYTQMDALADLSDLQPGDKVVLIQMSGVNVNTTNFPYSIGFSSYQDAGRFEMLAVRSVDNVLKQVEYSFPVTDHNNFSPGEKIQLVKIYENDYATVDGLLTASDWDGDTGGILAMVIYKKLTLNSNINVSNKGFRGGDPEPGYSGGCRPNFGPGNDTAYFHSSVMGIAGNKGEGNIIASWEYTKGPGWMLNGGGGGLGYFSGGGGGSHFGGGGLGGNQKDGCDAILVASGGYYLDKNRNFYGNNRVTMGGGGGSSAEDGTHSATKGGDGGGIIILLVDTLEANGNNIINNGESVTGTAMAGGGGGGAGGSILLDINVYYDNVSFSVRGGKGGNTGADSTGAGGGGGGGVIWLAGVSWPDNASFDTTRGEGGVSSTGITNLYANPGAVGGVIRELELPLNGFLFNSIDGVDTICAGQFPRMITGSMPKGGTETYGYTWLQSTDAIVWDPASGSGGLLYFYPDELTETTYFTRRVTSGSVVDTAYPIEVFVYDSIEGNIIDNSDTLCFGNSPGTLTGGALSGGDGDYGYLWQSSLNMFDWTDRVETSSLTESELNNTTYYRRIASSAKVCADTSSLDTITILQLITQNDFNRQDTAICEGLDGGMVKGLTPQGGDGGYSYLWLQSSDDISYSQIADSANQTLYTGDLFDDTYYKRIVQSGSDNVCIDTSGSYYIQVYETISNNIIGTDSTRYCAGDIPNEFEGNPPGGGDNSTYLYQWVTRIPGEEWSNIAGESGINYIPAIYEDTLHVARVVYSGSFDACIDTSNFIQVDVIPYISNNLQTNDTAVCEGARPLPFAENAATGGAGGYTYLWQSRVEGSGTWTGADETISSNNGVSYSPNNLIDSTHFRRLASSQICTTSSNTVAVFVYPSIDYNIITGSDIQYTCYNSSKNINAEQPAGGRPNDYNYTWEQSVNDAMWENAAGSNEQRNYSTVELMDSIYFRRIVRSGEYYQCKDTSAPVLIRINPLPEGDIVSAIDTACEGGEISVGYNISGTGPWIITLGETDPIYSESNITDPSGELVFTVSESAVIKMLDLIDDSTCHADVSGFINEVDLEVFINPDADAGDDDEVCGLTANLEALPTVGFGIWSGENAVFEDDTAASTVVTSGEYGEREFIWTETNWECIDTDTVEIIFYQQPEVPNAGDDMVLDYTFETTLNADEPDIGEGYWQFTQGNGTFDDSTQNNTRVTFDEVGEYRLTWTVVNGVCEVVDNSLVITVTDLAIYKGFSPNGDGVNDEFILNLSGREGVTVEVIIFDRRGGIVYKVANAIKEVRWNGRRDLKGSEGIDASGPEVPEGTYFYIIRERGLPDRTGYIELRR